MPMRLCRDLNSRGTSDVLVAESAGGDAHRLVIGLGESFLNHLPEGSNRPFHVLFGALEGLAEGPAVEVALDDVAELPAVVEPPFVRGSLVGLQDKHRGSSPGFEVAIRR